MTGSSTSVNAMCNGSVSGSPHQETNLTEVWLVHVRLNINSDATARKDLSGTA